MKFDSAFKLWRISLRNKWAVMSWEKIKLHVFRNFSIEFKRLWQPFRLFPERRAISSRQISLIKISVYRIRVTFAPEWENNGIICMHFNIENNSFLKAKIFSTCCSILARSKQFNWLRLVNCFNLALLIVLSTLLWRWT